MLPLEPRSIPNYAATSDCCEWWHPVTQSFSHDSFAVVNNSLIYKQLHVSFTSVMETLEDVQAIVDAANRHFARYETIKRFALLPRPLEVEKGELTPTMKIRRRIIEERFKGLLDSLYDE